MLTGGKHRAILAEAGDSEEEIGRTTALPPGFSRGGVVALLELGDSVDVTLLLRPVLRMLATHTHTLTLTLSHTLTLTLTLTPILTLTLTLTHTLTHTLILTRHSRPLCRRHCSRPRRSRCACTATTPRGAVPPMRWANASCCCRSRWQARSSIWSSLGTRPSLRRRI